VLIRTIVFYSFYILFLLAFNFLIILLQLLDRYRETGAAAAAGAALAALASCSPCSTSTSTTFFDGVVLDLFAHTLVELRQDLTRCPPHLYAAQEREGRAALMLLLANSTLSHSATSNPITLDVK